MGRFAFILITQLLMLNSATAVELSASEYELAKQDIRRLLTQESPKLNFLIAEVQSNKLVTSYRTPDERQGRFWLRNSLPDDGLLVLQIPHGMFDRYTMDIAELWWEQGIGDVLMFNTEQRYKTERSDLSRLRFSLFTAFTEALLDDTLTRDIPTADIVQLHGFNAIKRKTTAGTETDFILSNGTELPALYLQRKQSCLRDNGSLLARVYGRDVFELGATINPIGRLINATEQQRIRFLHIEMPLNIREKLVKQSLPVEVIQCLVER